MRVKRIKKRCCPRPVLKMGNIQWLLGEPLGQVITLRVFSLMKSPLCVHSKRLRVHRQNAHMFFNIWTCCRFSNVHTAGFPVDRHTHRARHFLMHSCCAVSWQSCCQSVRSHIDLHTLAWLKSRSTLSAFRPKPSSSARHVVHLTPRTDSLFLNQSSTI